MTHTQNQINLYPDQQEMIEAVAASMRRGNKAVLLQSATGSGKSIIGASMIQRAMSKDSSSWFIVPRKFLLGQMSRNFKKFGIPHSFIAADWAYNPYAKNYICSSLTLTRRLDKLIAPRIAFIDETHFDAGLDVIIPWLKAAGTYIVGLSATPTRTDGRGLGCWYDDMVCGKSIRWLIDNKRLSGYRPFAPSTHRPEGIRISNGDYAQGQLQGWARENRKRVGDAAAHYKEHAYGKLGIAFGVGIDDSKMIADTFRQAGIPAAHVDGETPDREKEIILRAYAKRELLYITNAELFGFGFDIADFVGTDVQIECLSDLAPSESLAKIMQRWGRVLRMKDEPALIFSHAGNFDTHGFPCDDREWTLADREKRGRASGERSLPVKQCNKCFFCHRPAPTCPNCGNVYEVESRKIEEVEGKLTEIEVATAKRQRRMEVGQAKTLEDLKRIAIDRGYKRYWVNIMAKQKGIKA